MSIQIPADILALPAHALDCLDKIQSYTVLQIQSCIHKAVLTCLSPLRIKTFFVDINLIVIIQAALIEGDSLGKLYLIKIKAIVSSFTLAGQLWQREKMLMVM